MQLFKDMRKKYFNTKEKAETHLEYRRTCAYKRIEERNDTILADASFVTYNMLKKKYFVFIQIITQSQMDDLLSLHAMNLEMLERLDRFALIPFSEEEKISKKQKSLKKTIKKYKTLDIEDYTINK